MHPLVHATKFFSCADIMFREPIAWISSPTLKFVVLADFKIWKLEIWQNQMIHDVTAGTRTTHVHPPTAGPLRSFTSGSAST